MGCSYHVKCLQCGNNFDVNSGGGFFFHLLHCDFCGKDKSIGFDEIGELHLRYIKGLPGPYCVASSSLDQHIKAVSYTHLRAHETKANLVCRLLLEKKKKK